MYVSVAPMVLVQLIGVLNVGRVLLRVCFLQLKGLGLSSTSRIVRGLFGLAEMHLVGEASLFTSRHSSKQIEGIRLLDLSSKKLIDAGFMYKYELNEMLHGSIKCCKEKGFPVRLMGTPPGSPPQLDGQSEAMSMKTRQSTQLRRLTLRTLDQPKPMINIDAATGRGLGPHKEKFNNYLGIHHRLTTPHLSLKDMLSGTGYGVTITQYYGRASHGSSNSSTSITQQQRNEIKEEELKEAIKIEFSQRGSQYSSPIEANIHVLGSQACTKGSNAETNANPSREEHVSHVIPTMGLYVQHQHSTHLVALGKIYEGGSTIHSMAYADDIVRVSVEKVIDGDAQVSLPMSEIQYVRQTLHTFIAWPKPLVKLVSDEDSTITPNKVTEIVQRSNDVTVDDPLHDLIKILYDIYEKPIELLWDSTKFGIPNVDAFLLTYADVNEIISGDKCLNIVIL
ncbi:Vestitone reductase [Glycine soja]